MYTTVIKDENGNEIIVPKSHRNTTEVIRRIAEETIKTYHLDCTVEEYYKRCKEKRNESTGSV